LKFCCPDCSMKREMSGRFSGKTLKSELSKEARISISSVIFIGGWSSN
jgi:hypothetical protein